MKKTKKQLAKIARGIQLLVLDVDGVMTDGGIILDGEGNELKRFHVRDGHGIKMLKAAGIEVAIITGRYSKVVERRAKELGITNLYQRCTDKEAALDELLSKLGVAEEATAYVGDDILDIAIMRRAGLSAAVADAHEDAKANAIMVTKNPGGRGAVRELTDFILKAKGLLEEA